MSELDDAIQVELRKTALALIKKHELERDGVVWCWRCKLHPALMPHLHCETCYEDWKVRNVR